MIGHFNAGELASFRAGTVRDGKAARISAHLSTCPQCAHVHSGLGNVSQLLGSIPAPAMPETLTQRLQAAIADEAALRSTRTVAPTLGEAGRGGARARRPSPRAWSSPLLLRGLAAAGVLVLLVGGGILLANQRGVGTASSSGEPTRPVRSRPSAAAVGSTAGVKLRYQHDGKYVYTNAVTSNVNYTKANLPADVRRVVANSTEFSNSAPNVVPVGTSARPRALDHVTVGRLESCLASVAPSGHGLVRLVAVAHFQGRPATIIVFQPVDNAFDVIVVGEACGPADQDILAKLVVPKK